MKDQKAFVLDELYDAMNMPNFKEQWDAAYPKGIRESDEFHKLMLEKFTITPHLITKYDKDGNPI